MAGLMSSKGASGCLLEGSPRRWLRKRRILVLLMFASICCPALMGRGDAPGWAEEIVVDDSSLDYSVPCQLANVSRSSQGLGDSCTYGLERLTDSNMSGFNYSTKISGGESAAFIYRIMGLQSASQGYIRSDAGSLGAATDILVKVSCLPFFKSRYILLSLTPSFLKPMVKNYFKGGTYRNWFNSPCKKATARSLNKPDVAMWKLANMCGVGHLMEEVRLGRVRGRMPETGYEFDTDALFMREVKGLTLKVFTEKIRDSNFMENFFKHQLNSSQVIEAAVFDLFTRQADRNLKNIYVNEMGNLKLIDNTKCMGEKVDSLFLPSTEQHTAAMTSFNYARTESPRLLWRNPSLVARMDYRCHSNGAIEKNYPPGLFQCMQKISNSSVEDIALDLGLDDSVLAANLKQSGIDMLQMGFEWTLYNGGPQRNGGGGYYPQPPCCKIINENVGTQRNKFLCELSWNLTTDLHHFFEYAGNQS